MTKRFILLFGMSLLIKFSLNAQYSAEYLRIIEKINSPTDSIKVEDRYENGNIRTSGYQINYSQNGENYCYLTGKHFLYFRSGQWNETTYDSIGNLMSQRAFDPDGNLYYESKTTYISSTATTVREFLDSDKHLIFKRMVKYFKYSDEFDKYYLQKEGNRVNGKRSGIWKFYYSNGQLRKEKVY